MLGDEEAVVVVLGLLATRGSGPDGSAAAVDGALAKINRVLPSTLRRQVEALEETLGFTSTRGGAPGRRRRGAPARRRDPPPPAACAPPTARSQARSRSASSARTASSSTAGRWYLAAYDHLRDDLRTFRVDRMWRTALAEAAAVPPPAGFDAVAHVTRSLASVPWKWEVEVLLDLPADEAARRIPATLAELVDDPEGTLLRMRVGSLDWMATVLAGLGCGFTIRRPDELRASVRALAAQLAAQAALAADGVDRLVQLAVRAAARRARARRAGGRAPS